MMGLVLYPYAAMQGMFWQLRWWGEIVMTPITRSGGIISSWTSLGTQTTPQQYLVCQMFEERLKICPQNLPPMWMTPEWRRVHYNRPKGQPWDWILFGNTWYYNIPHGRWGLPGKTDIHGEERRSISKMGLFIKWSKTWSIIKKWLLRVTSGEPLNYKELQSDRGIVNYVSITYRIWSPFLKVMHINLDPWRPHWDPELW